MNISLYRRLVIFSMKLMLFFFVMFFIGRIVFLFSYADFTELGENKLGLFRAFLVGGRFDISTILYGLLPFPLIWLVGLFIPKRKDEGFLKFFYGFSKFYLLIPLIAFLSFVLIDFFFYRMFQTRIDVVFFGIIYDDTTAVLNSVWSDYPVIKITIIIMGTLFSFFWFLKRIKKSVLKPINSNSGWASWIFLLLLPLFFLGMRGSIGLFPLQREHASVSNSPFINAFCYNPLYSLKFAYKEFKQNEIKPDVGYALSLGGFKDLKETRKVYLKNENKLFDEGIYARTPKNEFLKQNPPNVIFVQMESWSEHYFSMSTPEFNLIGELYDELDDLYYFRNSLPASNGTIYSLEAVLIGTPHHIIAQSPYYNVPYSSAVTLPYLENGYKTTFVTGGQITWRNLNNFLNFQGFKNQYDVNSITEKYPDTEAFVWGAHDEYLFRFVEDYLRENTNEPHMIFAMTISNHTPFDIPKNYKPLPLNIPDSIKKQFRVEEDLAIENFILHQYSSTELVRFINRIKNSPLGENTIIVATGDHNTRMVMPYNDENSFLQWAVPTVMYIPDKYKPEWVDTERMISHKDIYPTLFNLSLSDTRHVYTGDNFFDSTLQHPVAINASDYIADSVGVIVERGRTPHYFVWKDKDKRKLEHGDNEEHKNLLYSKLKAYRTMLKVKIYEDMLKAE